MAATLIQSSDIIDVSSLSICIYGGPGQGKTSLAQTADNPITLDLDRGAHRSFNRGPVMRFDFWKDVEEAWPEISKRNTVVVDTIGRGLDMLSTDIVSGNAKHGTAAGGLTLQGYGALKSRFAQWNARLFSAGKDRIFICHEKEEKDGDDRILRPDVQGGSYTELMKSCDLVGYLYRDRSGKRLLDFNPTDRHLGKNAAAWPIMEVPPLEDNQHFMALLIADAKHRIGKTALLSAEVAKVVDEWKARLESQPDLITLNGWLPEIGTLKNGTKRQVWNMICAYSESAEWKFSKESKQFIVEVAA